MMLQELCLTVFLSVAPMLVLSQSHNWWTVSSDELRNEIGALKEVKYKHKVFLSVIYNSPDFSSPREDAVIRLFVLQVLNAYKGFELVSDADQADLAIVVNASRIDEPAPGGQAGNFSAGLDAVIQTPLSVTVVVRGALLRNGTYRTRIIWELSSPNVRGDPGPAAGFAVDGFIGQLKKLRGES